MEFCYWPTSFGDLVNDRSVKTTDQSNILTDKKNLKKCCKIFCLAPMKGAHKGNRQHETVYQKTAFYNGHMIHFGQVLQMFVLELQFICAVYFGTLSLDD